MELETLDDLRLLDGETLQYAHRGRRLLAFFVDGFICYFFICLSLFPLFALAELDWIDKGERFELMAFFFFLLSSWLYFAYMESSARQATWGKYWLGLKVLNTQQEQISFGKASLRHLGRVACFFTLYVGFLIVFFTAKRQTLADIIAQTLVIKR